MGFITTTTDFLAAAVLTLLAWLIYLWANNLIAKIEIPALKEILGALESILLVAMLGGILYFFSVAIAMGIIVILFLITLIYIVRRTLLAIRTVGD